MSALPIVPDTKDWTWVLSAPCPECGFLAPAVDLAGVGEEIRRNATVWQAALGTRGADVRPRDNVWSPTEYACHVRDVHRLFAERVRLMLDQDAPEFANWDQDETAVADRYDQQRPADVAPALLEAAQQVAALYDGLPADSHDRKGFRSNGSEFTVDSIARYHLHDVVHHLWDVRRTVTVAAYDAAAEAYRAASPGMADQVQAGIDTFVAGLGPGARVLEIGSAGGRDALALEAGGLQVRRTDVAPGFVELLRTEGHHADVLDPLTDDLVDPDGGAYDGVWANASLLHVSRADLGVVLERLADVTRSGGLLRLSLKDGDGEGWSTHGSVALPRMFTYWRETPLRETVTAAGWQIDDVDHADGNRGERWLSVAARRSPMA